jgi:hypothetical protein
VNSEPPVPVYSFKKPAVDPPRVSQEMLSAAYGRFEVTYDSSDSERADDTPPMEQDELASTEAAGQKLTPSPIAVPQPPTRDSDSSDQHFVFTPGISKKERSVTFEGIPGRPVATPTSGSANVGRQKTERFQTPVGDLASPIRPVAEEVSSQGERRESPTTVRFTESTQVSSSEDPLVRQLDASRQLLQRIDAALARSPVRPKLAEPKSFSIEGEEQEDGAGDDIVAESVDVVDEEEDAPPKAVVEHEVLDVVGVSPGLRVLEEEEGKFVSKSSEPLKHNSQDLTENSDLPPKSRSQRAPFINKKQRRNSDSPTPMIVNHQGTTVPPRRPVFMGSSGSEDDLQSRPAPNILSTSEKEQSPPPQGPVIPNSPGSFGSEEDAEDIDVKYDNFMQLNLSGESSPSGLGETD